LKYIPFVVPRNLVKTPTWYIQGCILLLLHYFSNYEIFKRLMHCLNTYCFNKRFGFKASTSVCETGFSSFYEK
jgi:hypothetical protein